MSIKEYKELKGLKKENLRDNMTDIELVLNVLAEVTTVTISKQESPSTFAQSQSIARRDGKVANVAKKEYEEATGTKAVSSLNASDKAALEIKKHKEDKND